MVPRSIPTALLEIFLLLILVLIIPTIHPREYLRAVIVPEDSSIIKKDYSRIFFNLIIRDGDISYQDVDLFCFCYGYLHAVFEHPIDELATSAALIVALVFHWVNGGVLMEKMRILVSRSSF